jgi:hypothetical protein
MKRPRKPAQAPRALSPRLVARATERLLADYIEILEGSTAEEAKRIAQRAAAAGEVLEQIRRLGDLIGDGADAAQTEEDVLAKTRDDMAHENKP